MIRSQERILILTSWAHWKYIIIRYHAKRLLLFVTINWRLLEFETLQIKFSVLTQTGCVRMEMLLGNVTIFTVGYKAFPAMTSYLYLITVNTQNGQVESILKGHMYLRIEQRDKWWRGGRGDYFRFDKKDARELLRSCEIFCSNQHFLSVVVCILFSLNKFY